MSAADASVADKVSWTVSGNGTFTATATVGGSAVTPTIDGQKVTVDYTGQTGNVVVIITSVEDTTKSVTDSYTIAVG